MWQWYQEIFNQCITIGDRYQKQLHCWMHNFFLLCSFLSWFFSFLLFLSFLVTIFFISFPSFSFILSSFQFHSSFLFFFILCSYLSFFLSLFFLFSFNFLSSYSFCSSFSFHSFIYGRGRGSCTWGQWPISGIHPSSSVEEESLFSRLEENFFHWMGSSLTSRGHFHCWSAGLCPQQWLASGLSHLICFCCNSSWLSKLLAGRCCKINKD